MDNVGTVLLIKSTRTLREPEECSECGARVISDFHVLHIYKVNETVRVPNEYFGVLHNKCKKKFLMFLDTVNWNYIEEKEITKKDIEDTINNLENREWSKS